MIIRWSTNFSVLILSFLLSGCFSQNSIKVSKNESRISYDDISARYEHELELLRDIRSIPSSSNQSNKRAKLMSELHDEILLKHEEYNQTRKNKWLKFGSGQYENYPYHHYRVNLDTHVNNLENAGAKVYWKNEGLGRSIQDLMRELDNLKRYIVLHKEYNLERRMIEKKTMLALSNKQEAQKAKAKTKSKKAKAKNKKNNSGEQEESLFSRLKNKLSRK